MEPRITARTLPIAVNAQADALRDSGNNSVSRFDKFRARRKPAKPEISTGYRNPIERPSIPMLAGVSAWFAQYIGLA